MFFRSQASVIRYDEEHDTWAEIQPLPAPRRSSRGVVGVPWGRAPVLLPGGFSGHAAAPAAVGATGAAERDAPASPPSNFEMKKKHNERPPHLDFEMEKRHNERPLPPSDFQ